MAKDDIDLDKLDIDLDKFDFDDIPGLGNDDSRTPISKFTKGFTDNIKNKPFDADLIEQVMRQALPGEYSQLITAGQSVSGRVSSLYHKSTERAAPLLKDAKSVGRSLANMTKGKVPAAVTRYLERISSDDSYGSGRGESRDDAMNENLRSIFDVHQKRGMVLDAEKEKREIIRNRLTTDKLDVIAEHLGRMTGYQDSITYHWQRKSLELQYKSYFIQKDLLEASKTNSEKTLKALETITRNTALPEAIKIQNSEMFVQMAKERFINRIQQGRLGSIGDVIERVSEAAQRKVFEAIDSASMLMSSIDTGMSMGDMIDPVSMAGSFVGDKVSSVAGAELGRRAYKKLSENDKIKSGAARIGSFFSNPGGYFNTLRNRIQDSEASDTEESGPIKRAMRGLGRGTMSLLSDLVGTSQSDGLTLGSQYDDFYDPAVFDKRTYRTQNDVVPGLLGRILREVTSIRTGEEAPLLTYNYDRGKFTTDKTFKGDMLSRLNRSAGDGAAITALDRFISNADPDGKLSDSAKDALKRQMLINTNNDTGFNAYNMSKTDLYDQSISEKDKNELAQFFKDNYTSGKLGETLDIDVKIRDLSLDANLLGRYFTPVINEIELQLTLGNRSYLEEMGLVKDSAIDYDAIMDLILKETKGGGDMPSDIASERVSMTVGKLIKKGKNKVKSVSEAILSDDVKEEARYQAWLLKNSPEANKFKNKLTSSKAYQNVQKTYDKVTGKAKQLKTKEGRKALKDSLKNDIDYIKKVVKDPQQRDLLINDLKEEARYQAWLIKNSKTVEGIKGNDRVKALRAKIEAISKDPRVQLAKEKAEGLTEEARYQAWLLKNSPEANKIKSSFKENVSKGGYEKAMDLVKRNLSKVKDPKERAKLLESLRKDPRVSKAITTIEQYTGRNIDIEDIESEPAVVEPTLSDSVKATDPIDDSPKKPKYDRMDSDELLRMIELEMEMLSETKEIKQILTDQLTLIASSTAPTDNDGRRFGFRYGLRSGIGKALSGMGSIFKGYGAAAGGLLSGTGSLIKGSIDLAKRLNPINLGFKDIYVRGEKRPRLYAKFLKEGRYIDKASGKTIKSIKDINGEVVDRDDPENIVLSLEDFNKGLHDIQGKPILKNIANKVVDFYGGILAPVPAAARLLARGIRSFGDFMFNVVDVYVRGETTPRLTAHLMGKGYYRSGVDGKVIKSHKDINGPIYDIENNLVLGAEDLSKKGIVDVNGKPLKTNMEKFGGFLKSAAGMALMPAKIGYKLLKGAVKGTMKALSGIAKFSLRPFKAARTKEEFDVAAHSEYLRLLTSIYHVLEDRLPARKKKVFGDSDGDGDRDGSAADILSRRKNKKSSDADSVTKAEKTKERGKGLLASLASIFGIGGNDKNDGDTIIGGSVDMGGDDKDKKNKKGKFGKLKGLLSRIPGAALAGAALTGGVGLLSTLGGATLSAGGLLARGALLLGTGLVSTLGAPVVIGALAAGAAVYGGYKLYKHLRSKERDKLYLTKLRMTQYGVKWDNHDAVEMTAALEEYLFDKVYITDQGGEIKLSEDDVSKILEIFNIPTSEDGRVRQALDWFNRRFKPIYVTTVAMVQRYAPRAKLSEIDSLDKDIKLQILNNTMFEYTNPSPYTVISSPFGSFLSIMPSDIMDATEEAKAKIMQETEPKGRGNKSSQRNNKLSLEDSADKISDAVQKDYTTKRRANRFQSNSRGVQDRQQETQRKVNVATQLRDNKISDSSGFILPTAGSVSSPFGMRVHPISGQKRMHNGIDIASPRGTPIHAMANGTIQRREYSTSFGNVIYLKHDDGRMSRYAHMDSFAEGHMVGSHVLKGEVIGYVGNTGKSAGNHLHFEILEYVSGNYVAVDPLKFLEPGEAKSFKEEVAATERLVKQEDDDERFEMEGYSTIASTVKDEVRIDTPVEKPRERTIPSIRPDINRADLNKTQQEGVAIQKAIYNAQSEYQNKLADNSRKLLEVNLSMDQSLKSILKELTSGLKINGMADMDRSNLTAETKVIPPAKPFDASENKVTFNQRRPV